ncbi:hypothetical protein BKA70DRAFT_1269113 [Coprinopsis sp. MPI-PUGE-AT-0042]|nr:hypothetical protein BKA70DRAFT_1269113 [Coprinopsis sp. MPI-PUGE-AT-0042]
MQPRLQTTLRNSIYTQPQCPLYLDILEAILYEHRLDNHTLAQCALVSRTMLQLTRKALYRSVSLDPSENPYAFDQQRLLRTSLANSAHLCSYIHTLRLPLSDDPLLTRVMEQLTKVEILHQHYHHSSAGSSSSHRALRRLFGLTSLRKVTLEGSFPFLAIDFSAFSEVKDLEVSSAWGVAFNLPDERQHVRDSGSDPLSFPSHEPDPLPVAPAPRERGRRLRLDRLSLKTKALGTLCQLFNHSGPFIREQDSSDIDISHLRELHLDVCNPDDCDTIWSALRQCSHSLEVLSIRHLWNDSQSLTFSDSGLGLSNLTTLPLLRLLSYRSSAHLSTSHQRFPSLRMLKVIFDLGAARVRRLPWRAVSSYRGWAEIDDAIHSPRYKEYDGQESVREPGGLLSLLLNELPYLRHNPKFSML